ncbi:MAG: tRNA (cytidine(34)-2'-O)-methyltransferase [Elusimicrobia bacterium]|nr:tRNA (cytidine(34)-2'-O)-methyltransferase [Elusimicrobiota bacterium]
MNVVLVEPEIHWNTGNIGRTCVATGTTLHLVGPLGFSIADKEIRRAGLDYWVKLELKLHIDFHHFLASLPRHPSLIFFSTRGSKLYWDASYGPGSYLIFGSETKGLAEKVHRRFNSQMFRIPIGPEVRSLNLSTAAGVVLYEALRQTQSHGSLNFRESLSMR